MSYERPDATRLVFFCDGCTDTRDFDSVTGPDFAASWKECQAEGWFTHRPAGKQWEHYCPSCAVEAQKDIEQKRKNDRERERIKERNART